MNLDEIVQNTDNKQQTPPPQPVVVNPQQVPVVNQSVPQNTVVQQIPQVETNKNEVMQQQVAPAGQVPVGANPYIVPSAPQNINVTVGGTNEKIIIDDGRKKVKVNGFFRFLTLLSLLGVGILSLLEAIDVFSLNMDGFGFSQVYPIIVILSVVVLFRYRGFLAKLVGVILFATVVGGLGTIGVYHSLVPGDNSAFDETFAYSKSFPGNAVVHLNTYVGNYAINGSNTNHLLEGIYSSDRMLVSETGFTNQGEAYLYLKEDNNWNVLQNIKSDLMLDMSKEKVFDLYAKNFVGKYDVDLSGIKWKKIQLHGGVGDYDITLGSDLEEVSELELKSARSNIVFNVPSGVGVKLYYKQIAGSMELTNFNVSETEDNYYESLNIGTATEIVKINVGVGVGKFTLNWID